MRGQTKTDNSKWLMAGRSVVSRDWFIAVAVAVLVICFGLFLAQENNGVIPSNPDPTATTYTAEPSNRLTFMANWDGADYLGLSQQGYTSANNANFFPLYPLAIRLLSKLISSPLDCALLLAWAGFAGAAYFYIKLIRILFDVNGKQETLRGLLLFVLFPTGVFLFAPYTEGLFACFSLGALYFALRRQLLPVAVLTMLATATHVTGIFLLALIGLVLLEQRVTFLKASLTLEAGSLGLVAFMVFLQLRFHDPLAFISAQQQHGWLQHHYAGLLGEFSLINLFILVLLGVAAVYWYRRRRYGFAFYSLLYFLIPVLGGQMGGFNRYALMAFPVPLMLYAASRKNPLGYALIVAVFGILWTHYLFQYAGGYIGG